MALSDRWKGLAWNSSKEGRGERQRKKKKKEEAAEIISCKADSS
jgi:hypothetical protein